MIDMENLDFKIQPDDSFNSMNNLGKRKKKRLATVESVTSAESSFGLPPDEVLALKHEGQIDEDGMEIHEDVLKFGDGTGNGKDKIEDYNDKISDVSGDPDSKVGERGFKAKSYFNKLNPNK